MAFTDSEKASALKNAMKMAVDSGTDWDILKAEFFALSEDFRSETMDFLARIKNLSELKATTAEARTQSLEDFIDELEA